MNRENVVTGISGFRQSESSKSFPLPSFEGHLDAMRLALLPKERKSKREIFVTFTDEMQRELWRKARTTRDEGVG